MKVYILWIWDYEDSGIRGIYSTRELAEHAKAIEPHLPRTTTLEVQEHEVKESVD